MATALTADDMLAALKKWGITPKFYRPDWRTHNRDAQQGWGPLRGVVIHNFGSAGADVNQLAYLYRGDGPTSKKPGPLSQFAVTDDGQLWVLGWGTATHAGPGDPKAEAKARANTLPRDSEHTPTTIGTDAGTVTINPHYLGVEQCHGPEGPTPAQHATTVRWAAAMLDMMGGPAAGYGAGSVLMHRELTKNRSDPQNVPKDGSLRREVAVVLAAGVTPTPPPAPPEVLDMQFSDVIPGSDPAVTVGQALVRGAYAYAQVVEGGSVDRRLDAAVLDLAAVRAALKAGDVTDAQAILDRIEVKLTVTPEPDAPTA